MTKPLDDIFATSSTVKVLRVLAASELDLAGRQVAALAGLNPQTTQNALDHLNQVGLLSVRQVGRAKLYRFRPGHTLVEKLLAPLFSGERLLVEGAANGGKKPAGEPEPGCPPQEGACNHKENDQP